MEQKPTDTIPTLSWAMGGFVGFVGAICLMVLMQL